MFKLVSPIPARPLFCASTSLQKSFVRRFKFIRTLEADNRGLLRRLISKVKVLFNLEGEAHGFIRSPVFPDSTQMRFLLSQARFLKTFVSNLGCGIKYIIEERKLGRHFKNLASEYFNILEPETWNSIGRKRNFKKAKINISGLNEFIPQRLKIDEELFQKFVKTRAHRLFASLIRAKNLRIIDISYSDMDGIFRWAFRMIEKILPILNNKTSIEFNLLSGSERHALAGIAVTGNYILFQLPSKLIPKFVEINQKDTGKYYKLNFYNDDMSSVDLGLHFKTITNGRFLLDRLQEFQPCYFIPESITNLFLRVRATSKPESVLSLCTIDKDTCQEKYVINHIAKLSSFLRLDLLTLLTELEIEFESKSSLQNINFLDILTQVNKLEYLSVMIKVKEVNLLEFASYINNLLKNGLKGLELKFDISLQDFIIPQEIFESVKMLRIFGDISPVENLEYLLQSLHTEKLWLEGIPITNTTLKKIFQVLGKSLRGNDIKLKLVAKTEQISKDDFWVSIIEMLKKIKGVKLLNIILEARMIVLNKDDVKKIYDALCQSRCCLEKLVFRVSRGSFVEFMLVNGIYKISSHGFKPPMVKMWIIEPNGNWTEVFTQKDNSPEDFKKLGIPML